MAYRVVNYIICAEFWGTNITVVSSTNSVGRVPPSPLVIYVDARTAWNISLLNFIGVKLSRRRTFDDENSWRRP